MRDDRVIATLSLTVRHTWTTPQVSHTIQITETPERVLDLGTTLIADVLERLELTAAAAPPAAHTE